MELPQTPPRVEQALPLRMIHTKRVY